MKFAVFLLIFSALLMGNAAYRMLVPHSLTEQERQLSAEADIESTVRTYLEPKVAHGHHLQRADIELLDPDTPHWYNALIVEMPDNRADHRVTRYTCRLDATQADGLNHPTVKVTACTGQKTTFDAMAAELNRDGLHRKGEFLRQYYNRELHSSR